MKLDIKKLKKILIDDINSRSDGTISCERFDFPVFNVVAKAISNAELTLRVKG